MKKLGIYFGLLSLFLLFSSGCSLYIPMDWEQDYSPIRVLIIAEPDDAQVLLNGKLLGEAYEFSTPESALRLRSRSNELIIKKKGYIEEVIDLYEYTSNKITVRIKLRPDTFSSKQPSRSTVIKPPVTKTEKKPEYIGKKAVPLKSDDLQKEEMKTEKATYTELTLTITPPDASIYIDGEFFGISPKNGVIKNLRLKSTQHTISVVKPGFKSITQQVDLKDKKKHELTIHLMKG